MPYLSLDYPRQGTKEYRIGNAIFVQDSEENWSGLVSSERPKHLEMYRDFPDNAGEGLGAPLHGTLVISQDEKWLMEHIEEAVAVLYFLGDTYRSRPAECFAYHLLRIEDRTSSDGNLVCFTTKHAESWESADSLLLLPPRALYGNIQKNYRLDLEREEHQELLSRINADPHDRLVMAVRLYFRTQFSDTFMSPLAENFASHCGALEAALGIDARGKKGVGESFATQLAGMYGNEECFETFFYGLFVSRSLFVHGVSANQVGDSAGKEAAGLQLFADTRGKISLMWVITRDVICRALGREDNALAISLGIPARGSALPLLRTILHSDAHWSRTKALLTKEKAADCITSLTDTEFRELETLACHLNDHFDWQCVRKHVEPSRVRMSICTCALVIVRLTGSSGPVYEQAVQLGNLADAGSERAIEEWIFGDRWKTARLRQGDRLAVMQRIAWELAKFFDRHRIINW